MSKRLIKRIEHRDGTATYKRLSQKKSDELKQLKDKALRKMRNRQ